MSPLVRSTLIAVAGLASVFAFTAPTLAQDYTHPKEMELPAVRFLRPDPHNMRVEMVNGLAAYIAVDGRTPLVSFTAFVGAGSGHGRPGEAEVTAAALRRGPASMSDGAFRRALAEMTAAYSVSVSHEETEVTLEVPVEDWQRALEIFGMTLATPAFGERGSGGSGRSSQTGGIDYATSLQGAVDLFDSRLYSGHRFGEIATQADMEAARGGGAQRFHATHFVPTNTVLAIAGDFHIIEASTQVKETFEDWGGGDRPGPVSFASVSTSAPRTVLQANADKLQGWVVIGQELPVVPPEEEAALHVMDYILGAYHLDSRLFRASRETRGLTNDNSSFLEPGMNGPGSYTLRTYGRPEAVRLLVDVTFRELEAMRVTLPTADEMFVAKGALVDGSWMTRYTTGLDATRNYALEWLRHGSHDASASYPERVRAVTPQQVRQAARRYLAPDRMIVSVVGPLELIGAAPMIESEPQLGAWGTVERVGGGR